MPFQTVSSTQDPKSNITGAGVILPTKSPAVSVKPPMKDSVPLVATEIKLGNSTPPTPTLSSLQPAANSTLDVLPVKSNVQTAPVSEVYVKSTQKSYSLEEIVQEAVSIGASDIHINEGYRVYARKNKVLTMLRSQIVSKQFINNYINEISRFDSFSRNILNELQQKEDFDMSVEIYGQRFRVNLVKSGISFSISMRLIPDQIKSLEQLQLPSSLESLTNFSNGLVLVTGATGSGKSTTLSALVNIINQKSASKIITLEDPVEYIYPKSNSIVVQRSLGIDFEDWENGIKSVLRQDPNTVVIGEIRDSKSLEATLKVAETGHLVFATLHTNSAASTIQRLIDMFSDEQKSYARSAIASSLRAVVSQELMVSSNASSVVPALELLLVNNAVQNLIKEEQLDQVNNTIATSSAEGMILMESYKKMLRSQGLIK